MKNYATITIIIVLICSCGCRSHSTQLDTSVRAEQKEAKKEIQSGSINQQKIHLETQKSWTATQISKETTLVTYDPASGNVQSIQTTRRQIGRNELADGSRQGSESTQLDKTTHTDIQSDTKVKSDEHRESKGDSRPVQGWKEWGIIALVGGIVVLIIYLMKKVK